MRPFLNLFHFLQVLSPSHTKYLIAAIHNLINGPYQVNWRYKSMGYVGLLPRLWRDQWFSLRVMQFHNAQNGRIGHPSTLFYEGREERYMFVCSNQYFWKRLLAPAIFFSDNIDDNSSIERGGNQHNAVRPRAKAGLKHITPGTRMASIRILHLVPAPTIKECVMSSINRITAPSFFGELTLTRSHTNLAFKRSMQNSRENLGPLAIKLKHRISSDNTTRLLFQAFRYFQAINNLRIWARPGPAIAFLPLQQHPVSRLNTLGFIFSDRAFVGTWMVRDISSSSNR